MASAIPKFQEFLSLLSDHGEHRICDGHSYPSIPSKRFKRRRRIDEGFMHDQHQ
jgi:hypothetical protein